MEPQCSCSACSTASRHVTYQYSDKLTDTHSVASCEDLNDRHVSFNDLTNSHNTLRPFVAKLSAQIMNIPFKDIESSLRRHDPAPHNVSELTTFDIFDKIKEVYKACSCKVCECILGKSQKNELCKCKPCDCEECKKINKKVTISNKFTPIDVTQAGSKCLKLQRNSLKEIANQEFKQECNCKPCECTECPKSVSSPCSCDQCFCIESNTRYSLSDNQKLAVAAVESYNQSHQECMCAPCNCDQCIHRPTTNLHHEISTEINRPDGCQCEACLNESCLRTTDDYNTCRCQRGNRVTRKPVQRNTDFDIHTSMVSRQNLCRRDIIAMFAAISKIYPVHSQVKECKFGRCKCLHCNNDGDSADDVKKSNFAKSDNNRVIYDIPKYKSGPLYREFVTRESSLKSTKPCHNNLERPSEMKTISKFSTNNAWTCSPCECIDIDNMVDTCTGDVCDCTHCKCERCVSKDEVIYPIKKVEKLTPAILLNKINRSFITFCDEKNQNDADYETPMKITRLSPTAGYYKMNVAIGDEQSHEHYPNIEKQLYQKVSTKLKNKRRVKPFIDSYNIAQALNRNGAVQCQTSNSKIIADADYPVSNCMERGSNTQSDNEYETKTFNTSGQEDFNYLVTFNGIKHKKLKTLSKNNTKNSNNSLFYNRNATDLFGINSISSRFIKDSERNVRKFKYDKCLVENDKFLSVNESSQSMIIGGNNSSDKAVVAQSVDQNKNAIPRLNKAIEYCKRDMRYSKSIEKAQKDNIEVSSEESKNSENLTTRNNFNLDEDYRRVQRTIKDARTFSLHLLKLLEEYEKANREFESVYHKLTHSTKTCMVHHSMNSIPQHVSMKVNEDLFSENYSKTDKHFSHNIEPKLKKLSNENSCNSSCDEDVLIEFKQDTSNTLSFNNSDLVDSIICEEKLYPIIESNTPTSIPLHDSVKKRNIKKKSTRYKIYKQDAILTKRRKLFAPTFAKCSTATETFNNFEDQINDYHNKELEKADKSKLSIAVIESAQEATNLSATTMNTHGNKNYFELHPTITHQDADRHRDVVMINSPLETEHSKAKETFCRTTDSEVTVGVYRKQSLEKGIQEAVKAIKLASMTWESNYAKAHQGPDGRHENVTLMRLHYEVKKLLEMPLLQNSEVNYVESTRSVKCKEKYDGNGVQKCKSLKVNSVTLRKLSDSTILVKWQVPRVLENVLGYEVLLNGRPMKKIQDNMCYESILSGLPRSDKFLVTVITVTKRLCVCGHSPAVTVVCRPTTTQ